MNESCLLLFVDTIEQCHLSGIAYRVRLIDYVKTRIGLHIVRL